MYYWISTYIISHHEIHVVEDVELGSDIMDTLMNSAIDAYFEKPIDYRIRLHEQVLKKLQTTRDIASAKESAAMNWILDDNDESFGPSNPIFKETCEFVRSLVEKYRAKHENLNIKVQDEMQWKGGHELGESDTEPSFDITTE